MLTGSCHCGKASWTLKGDPGSITACNCTLCRRYGALWAYDYEGERITVTGQIASYNPRRKGQIVSRNTVLPILRLCIELARFTASRGWPPAHGC